MEYFDMIQSRLGSGNFFLSDQIVRIILSTTIVLSGTCPPRNREQLETPCNHEGAIKTETNRNLTEQITGLNSSVMAVILFTNKVNETVSTIILYYCFACI